MGRAKSLVRRALWWSRWDSNPRPLRCESDYRQIAKYLPFRKLQPPREINGFPVLSHSLPSATGSFLVFLSTYWPLGNLGELALSRPFAPGIHSQMEAPGHGKHVAPKSCAQRLGITLKTCRNRFDSRKLQRYKADGKLPGGKPSLT